MEAMYIIGEPGVGKSTLTRHLTRGLPYEDTDSPFAMRRYDCGVLELGGHRKDYPGTDTLALDVQPKVVEFLEGYESKYLLAEGDRLANAKFFDSLLAMGYNLAVVAIIGPEVAAKQRKVRDSHQNATWLKGRQTKVERLIVEFNALVTIVDAGQRLQPTEDWISDLAVVAKLRAAREAFLADISPVRA